MEKVIGINHVISDVITMLVENLKIQRRLQWVVAQFSDNIHLKEELMQEAMIHLWRKEEQDPGKKEVWYLQSCRFHLQNFLRLGRSVDSLKHAQAQVRNWEQMSNNFNPFRPEDLNGSLWDEVSINDFLTELSQSLTRQERETLVCLMDGLSARQTAKRLNISHTLVNRHRSRIANMALKFGFTPPRNRPDIGRREAGESCLVGKSGAEISS